MLSGIVEAKMQKEDIWGFVAQMSTSIKNLSVTYSSGTTAVYIKKSK